MDRSYPEEFSKAWRSVFAFARYEPSRHLLFYLPDVAMFVGKNALQSATIFTGKLLRRET
jgi:hypothetical protein